MTTAIIGSPTRTNLALARSWRLHGVEAVVLWPAEAGDVLGQGDVAIIRLDVLPTLDGVEPGLEDVQPLARRGIRVVNTPSALLEAHDKLLTAYALATAGIPQPRSVHLGAPGGVPELPFPCVVKPRFGSWGEDVFLCRSPADLAGTLDEVRTRPWWTRHGALAQELVGPPRRDLRIVVAGGRVVAAAERVAAEGEWRTNASLGGRIAPATVPPQAADLAMRAAKAIGIDLAGVDLLPHEDGWVVLELNGAVDFDARYSLPGLSPFRAILDALGIPHAILGETPELHERKEPVMTKQVAGSPARPGDEIVITGHSVGDAPRTAVIQEVLGEAGHERFRVRWEDGHESILFPGEDAIIRRPERRARTTK